MVLVTVMVVVLVMVVVTVVVLVPFGSYYLMIWLRFHQRQLQQRHLL
jgi:hypothetical protein